MKCRRRSQVYTQKSRTKKIIGPHNIYSSCPQRRPTNSNTWGGDTYGIFTFREGSPPLDRTNRGTSSENKGTFRGKHRSLKRAGEQQLVVVSHLTQPPGNTTFATTDPNASGERGKGVSSKTASLAVGHRTLSHASGQHSSGWRTTRTGSDHCGLTIPRFLAGPFGEVLRILFPVAEWCSCHGN